MPGVPDNPSASVLVQLSTDTYFSTLRRRLVVGRLLSTDDVSMGRHVAVVNVTFARDYFGTENPLGHHTAIDVLHPRSSRGSADQPYEIVGVVADAKNHGVREPTMPELIVPISLSGLFDRFLLVRTAESSEFSLERLRREVWAIDSGVIVTDGASLSSELQRVSYAEPQFGLFVLGMFAAAGLILVAVGVYGVAAYVASLRRREMAIRVTLGAQRSDIIWALARGPAVHIVAGVGFGLGGSVVVSRALASLLVGIRTWDTTLLCFVVSVSALAALLSCYAAVRRTCSVDPMQLLRD